MKIKNIIILSSVVAFLGLGTFAGIKMVKSHQSKIDLPSIDEEDERYRSMTEKVPESGTPKDYDAIKNLYIANGVVEDSTYYSTTMTGTAKANVIGINYTQSTINTKVVNDDEAFLEAISLSKLMKVAEQRYVTPNSYLIRKGKNVSEDGASYDQSISSLGKENYLNKYGNLPYSMSQYILNDEAILSGTLVSSTEDTFTYYYEFEPEFSTIKYARTVMTMGGASSLPTFSKATMTVVMDQTWHVISIDTDEIYDLAIFGNLTIHATASEVFTFHETPQEISVRSEFEPFFNADIIDPPQDEKTGMNYLTEAFTPLLNGDLLHIQGQMELQEHSYAFYADIDFNTMQVKATLDDALTLYYDHETLSLMIGDLAFSLPTDQLTILLKEYFDIDSASFDMSGILESSFVTSLLSSMEEEITNESCFITFTADFGKIGILMDIDADNQASLQSIQADLTIADSPCFIQLSFADSAHQYAKLPDQITQLDHLDTWIASLKSFIEHGSYQFTTQLSYPLQGDLLSLHGNGYLQWNIDDLTDLTIDLSLTISYQDGNIVLNATYQDEKIYIAYKDKVCVCLTIDEVKVLLQDILGEIIPEEIKSSDIIEQIDFLYLLKSIWADDNSIGVCLSLAQFSLNDNVKIDYTKQRGFLLQMGDLFTFNLVQCDQQETNFTEKYETIAMLNYQDLLTYWSYIEQFLNNKTMQIDIAGTIFINEKKLGINGEVYLDLSSMNLDAILQIVYDDQYVATIQLCKVQNQYLLNAGTISVLLSDEEFILLQQKVETLFSLSLPHSEGNLSLSFADIEKVLDSLTVRKDGLSVIMDLGNLIPDSKPIQIDLSLANSNQFFITTDLGIELTITSGSTHKFEISALPTFTYQDLSSIVDMIASFIENPYFTGDYLFTYQDLSLQGDLYFSFENLSQFTLTSNLLISYQDLSVPLKLQWIDEKIYVSYQEQYTIELTVSEINSLLEEIQNMFEISLPDFSLPADKVIDLSSLLSAVKTSDQLSFMIQLAQLDIDSIAEIHLANDELTLYCAPYLTAHIRPCAQKEVISLQGYHLIYEEIHAYVEVLSSYLACPQYVIDIDISQGSLLVTGQAYLDFSTMDVEVFLDVTYQNVNFALTIQKIGDIYQIQSGTILARLSADEMVELLTTLQEKYELMDEQTVTMLTLLLQNSFDLSTIEISFDYSLIASFLNGLHFDQSGFSLQLDGSILQMPELNKINFRYYKTQSDVLTMTMQGIEISLQQNSGHVFSLIDEDHLTMKEINYILSKVDALSDMLAAKTYMLQVNGTVYDNETITYQIDGSLYLAFAESEALSFSSLTEMKADLLLQDQTMIHKIELIYLENRVYVTYDNFELNSNPDNDASKGTTRISMSANSLLTAINYMNQMFIKDGMLNQLFGSYGEQLTTDVLDGAIHIGDEDGTIDINQYFADLIVNATSMSILINHDALNDYNPGGIAEIMIKNTINSDHEVVAINGLSVHNFYTDENTQIQLEATISTESKELSVPTGSYLDLDTIPELLKVINYTIELKNYDVSGNINVGLGSLNLAAIPLTLKATIPDNQPFVYLKLEVPYITYVIEKVTNAKTDSYLYFNQSESDIIYMKRDIYKRNWKLQWVYDSTDYLTIHKDDILSEFLPLFCYLFNFSDYIIDQINGDGSGSSTMYYANLLSNYTCNENQYAFELNGSELTGGVLGNIQANIVTTDIEQKQYLQQFDATTTVYSILSMSLQSQLNQITAEVDMSSYQRADYMAAS